MCKVYTHLDVFWDLYTKANRGQQIHTLAFQSRRRVSSGALHDHDDDNTSTFPRLIISDSTELFMY